MTYPLGWPVISQLLLQRERWPGIVHGYGRALSLVRFGQEVLPDQPVMRLERSVPGASPDEISTLALPLSSSREPLLVPAGLHGHVVAVTGRGGVIIKSTVAVLQGRLGVGRQVAGVLTLWQESMHGAARVIPPGALLVVPGPLTFALLRQAQNSGVSGIIASSISLKDLEGFLRIDLFQLLQATDIEAYQANLPDITLLFTEGLGELAMSVPSMQLLNTYQGSLALLTGTTSLRHHFVPELLVSLPVQLPAGDPLSPLPDPHLMLGARVCVYAGEHAGAVGLIDYFFSYEQVFPSGIRARALRIRRDDGSFCIVPVMHVQRIG